MRTGKENGENIGAGECSNGSVGFDLPLDLY